MNVLEDSIRAGEIHRKVREYIEPLVKPNVKIIDLVNLIEDKIREEVQKSIEESQVLYGPQINGGIAFPTGISINNVAAHYTPLRKDETIIKESDVVKIDYGVHLNGHIIDAAFTINLDNKFKKVLDASRESVSTIIKEIGVGSRFNELSQLSKEIVESYELVEDQVLKVIDNLAGHNILPWKIHGGKLLYGLPNPESEDLKVCDGDKMAIEIFVSNGDGTTMLDLNPRNYTHYMLKSNDYIPLFQNKKTNELSKIIKNNFKTLAFCPRFIDNINKKHVNYNHNLQELFRNGILNSYPPLLETDPNSVVAQFEHTIIVGESRKMVLS